MKGFSIIVCCYNSERVLPETLHSLSRLHIHEALKVELIVIDNCCTDKTATVAEESWRLEGAPFQMTLERENVPGLSAARERGIKMAQYDYVIFCDDDNRLAADYLTVAEKLLSTHPEAGVLGGYGIPQWENMPGYWPEDFYIYGSGPQAEQSGKVPWVHGAGIIIRKTVFNALKRADFSFILSDRKQDQLTSGGDYELCCAIALAGYDIWYDQQLQFSHFIASERMTWAYCKAFIEQSAPALDVLEVYHFLLRYKAKNAGLLRLYLRQMKTGLYHCKGFLVSSALKWRYRRSAQVYFLERFHQRFHLQRMKSIVLNTMAYRALYKRLCVLKAKLKHVDPMIGATSSV